MFKTFKRFISNSTLSVKAIILKKRRNNTKPKTYKNTNKHMYIYPSINNLAIKYQFIKIMLRGSLLLLDSYNDDDDNEEEDVDGRHKNNDPTMIFNSI